MAFVHLSLKASKIIGNYFIRQQQQQLIAKKEKNQLLKKKVIEKLVLKLPDFNHPFQVRCDGSGTAIGAILSKEDKHITYFSENLNESKHKYSSYDKEFYVVVQDLKYWRHYLMANEFVLG